MRRAALYLWLLLADPNPPGPGAQPVITTRSRNAFTDQVAGHVLYVRVAVVRANGGVSRWSEAAQVTAR